MEFFETDLGAEKCVELKIEAWHDAESYACRLLQEFQEESARRDGKVLEMVYISAHGGPTADRTGLRICSGRGQEFEWNELQKKVMSNTSWDVWDGDTFVLLNCCHAGLALNGRPLLGCKDLFVASSALVTASGPSQDSFPSTFIAAGRSFDGLFSFSEWAEKTIALAGKNAAISKPVYHAFEKNGAQITFRPVAMTERPKIQETTEYEEIKALIITFEDHDLGDALEKDVLEIIDMFENDLGVSKCRRICVPKHNPYCDAGAFLQSEITLWKAESFGEKVLNFFYYAGHGELSPDKNTLVVSSKPDGQELDWNALQRDAIFPGEKDTVVFMDCCLAGLEAPSQGNKYIVGACSDGPTVGSLGYSFTSMLPYTFSCIKEVRFSLDDWISETAKYAHAWKGVCPVIKFSGNGRFEEWIQPSLWMEKKKIREAERAEAETEAWVEKRLSRIGEILKELYKLGRLEFYECARDFEIAEIEADLALAEEEVAQAGVYRACRRIEDRKAEAISQSLGDWKRAHWRSDKYY
jgi:hypothetical protein